MFSASMIEVYNDHQNGRFNDAITKLKKGVEEAEKNPLLLEIWSDCYTQKYQVDKNEEDYIQALSLLNQITVSFSDANLSFQYGELFFLHGDLDIAIKYFLEYFQIPSPMASLRPRGEKLLKDSISQILENISSKEDASERLRLFINWGKCFHGFELYQGALDCSKAAMKLDINDEEALNLCINSAHRAKQSADTIEFLNTIADEKICTASFYHAKAQICYIGRELLASIQHYDKAIKLSPNNALYYFERASLKKNVEYLDDALPFFDKAIALDSQTAKYYFGRGEFYKSNKQIYKAACDFSKGLALDRSPSVQKQYAQYQTLFNLINNLNQNLADDQAYNAIVEQINTELVKLDSKAELVPLRQISNNAEVSEHHATFFSSINPLNIMRNGASLLSSFAPTGFGFTKRH